MSLTVSHDIERIEGRRVEIHDCLGGDGWQIDEVDAVVLAMQRAPRLTLFRDLDGTLPDVRLVGDARAPRTTEAVIHEAELLARSL